MQIKQDWCSLQKYLRVISLVSFVREFYFEIFTNHLFGTRWNCFVYLTADINISLKKRHLRPCNGKQFLTNSGCAIALKEIFKAKEYRKSKTEITYQLKNTNSDNNLHLVNCCSLPGSVLGFFYLLMWVIFTVTL